MTDPFEEENEYEEDYEEEDFETYSEGAKGLDQFCRGCQCQ